MLDSIDKKFTLENKNKRFKPLSYTNNGMVFYHKGALYLLKDNKMVFLIKLNSSFKDMLRVLERAFRREPRSAASINGDVIVFSWEKSIWIYDTKNNKARRVFNCRKGFSDVLNILATNKNDYLALWGDYGSNPSYETIKIYCLMKNYDVKVCYEFPQKSIRHVHNIIEDGPDGFYIFAGDNEKKAGIYRANNDFSDVYPLAVGNNRYRAVCGRELYGGLLYITDSVMEDNHIYYYKDKMNRVISDTEGSCIYGCCFNGGYLFSTTVEPDESNNSIFCNRRGKGIKSNRCKLVFVNPLLLVTEVLEFEKDLLPMKLFQYGFVQIVPEDDRSIWIYPCGVKKYDGIPMRITIKGMAL